MSYNPLRKKNYGIFVPIGRGHFGKVFKSRKDGKDVAIKEIDVGGLDQNEANIIKQLDHLNVTKANDIISFKNKIFIVMDLMERTVAKELELNGKFLEYKALVTFIQVANGLRYLHSKSIAHRDLKCDNILLGKWKNDHA